MLGEWYLPPGKCQAISTITEGIISISHPAPLSSQTRIPQTSSPLVDKSQATQAALLQIRRSEPPSFDWVRETYRQRFSIETTYRQLHQARIRTSTRDPAQRLLDVGIALILRNVWVWLHQMVLARPRRGGREIRLDLLRFRRMLLWLTHVVEGTLGVRDSVIVELQL